MQKERSPAGWLGSSLFWGMASDSGEWFLAACTTPALCLAVCRWAGPRYFGSPTLRGGSVPHGVWHIPVPRRSGVAASRRSEMPVCRRRCCSIFRSLGVPVPGFSARPPSPVSRSPPGSPAASEPPYAAVAIGLLPLALVVVLVVGLGRPEVRCRGDARHHVVPLCA